MDTYDSVFLGERVRRARMAHGWKQKELAERTGVPQGNISRIERGQIQDMHLSRFITLMRTLNVSADYLLGFDTPEHAASNGSSQSRKRAKRRTKEKA